MKKLLLLMCLLSLSIPVFSAENNETAKYMNQSQSFSGFNKSLPQNNEFKKFEKPTKVTAQETFDDYLNEFDDDGFRKEKPVSTEKKVIKHISDANTRKNTQYTPSDRPMRYDLFPKSFDDANNNMIMMPTSIPGLF